MKYPDSFASSSLAAALALICSGSRRSVSSSLLCISRSLVKRCRNANFHAEMIVMSPTCAPGTSPKAARRARCVPHRAGLSEPTTSRRGASVTCIQPNRCLIFVGSGTYTEGLNRIGTRYQVPYPGVLIFIRREHRLDGWIYLSRTAQYGPSFK